MDHSGGFSLDATVRIEANDRRGLERVLRYCARPPFAAQRIEELLGAGRFALPGSLFVVPLFWGLASTEHTGTQPAFAVRREKAPPFLGVEYYRRR